VRINDLLNAFLHLRQPTDRATVAAIFPSLVATGESVAPDTANASGEQAAAAPGAVSQRQHAVTVPLADSISVAGPALASGDSSPALCASQRSHHSADQLPVELLVGDAYYAAKDQLIHHEQVWPAVCGSCAANWWQLNSKKTVFAPSAGAAAVAGLRALRGPSIPLPAQLCQCDALQ
jgi:hypothetical protein